MSVLAVAEIVTKQNKFFATGKLKDLQFRKQQLKKLKSIIVKNEKAISKALYDDMRKHEFEAYMSEIGFVLKEIDYALENLSAWAKPQKVKTPLFHIKASSYIYHEAYGTALIIAPWNYPFQLLFAPLIGAIAAGNTVILKPSEVSSHTSSICAKIINDNFELEYLYLAEGGVKVTQDLLNENFDYIFYTGNTKVGKIIYQAAANNLTPVTLELGGKSPCIIDKNTDIELTAKRIIWGKFLNAGQTCIAPDYLLCDLETKEKLKPLLIRYIKEFFTDDAKKSEHYPRIINDRHFDRIVPYINEGDIVYGGEHDKNDLYIAPTILENLVADSSCFSDEIFGPILPIVVSEDIDASIEYVNKQPKPLVLYVFSNNNKNIEKVLSSTSSGGVTVNDTLMHIVNAYLPFGGVGESGIGGYHGKHSFDLFSHKKSVLKRSFWVELPFRYAPYKFSLNLLKQLMKWTL